MIIDTHAHIGRSMFSGVDTTEAELVANMDAHGVAIALVMPQPTLDPVPPIHDRIGRFAQANPGRIFGMCSHSPYISDADYRAEARRCVQEMNFVALKLHPLGHNLSPAAPEAEKVFATAQELGVPVIVHTGLGTPWSLPALCIPPALKYPGVPVILAHAGFAVYTAEAMVAAELCPNIILEPSWCPTYQMAKMVERFGAERVIMGSDHMSNLPVELVKFRSIGLTERQLRQVFWETPRRVFAKIQQRGAGR